jgi:hypothetical protein
MNPSDIFDDLEHSLRVIPSHAMVQYNLVFRIKEPWLCPPQVVHLVDKRSLAKNLCNNAIQQSVDRVAIERTFVIDIPRRPNQQRTVYDHCMR